MHAVVDADTTPERVMIDLKAYASRGLGRKEMWARHGSTIYLWEADEVANAVRYVVSRQGEPMAVYFADWIFTSLS